MRRHFFLILFLAAFIPLFLASCGKEKQTAEVHESDAEIAAFVTSDAVCAVRADTDAVLSSRLYPSFRSAFPALAKAEKDLEKDGLPTESLRGKAVWFLSGEGNTQILENFIFHAKNQVANQLLDNFREKKDAAKNPAAVDTEIEGRPAVRIQRRSTADYYIAVSNERFQCMSCAPDRKPRIFLPESKSELARHLDTNALLSIALTPKYFLPRLIYFTRLPVDQSVWKDMKLLCADLKEKDNGLALHISATFNDAIFAKKMEIALRAVFDSMKKEAGNKQSPLNDFLSAVKIERENSEITVNAFASEGTILALFAPASRASTPVPVRKGQNKVQSETPPRP